MKLGDPASQVELARVVECTSVGSPTPSINNPKPKYSIKHSIFKNQPTPSNSMTVDFIRLVAAIVRTAATGKVVSARSTLATSSLAEGVLQYLHSTARGFSIDREFHELKDFVGTAYTGVLGAGLAYLRMLHDKYAWKAHYEEIVTPSSLATAGPEPDFVFANELGDLAVIESKGTGKNLGSAVTAAKNGYLRQVEPASHRALHGGLFPSLGYAFGTALNTAIGAKSPHIQIACVFRKFSPGSGAAAGGSPRPPAKPSSQQISAGLQLVQKANYDELFRQLRLNSESIEAIVQSSSSDETLYQSPDRYPFVIHGEVWTANIALPIGIIRRIARRQYPEALAAAVRSRGPTVVGGKLNKDLIFVNFPDHSRVLLRKEHSGEPYAAREIVLE